MNKFFWTIPFFIFPYFSAQAVITRKCPENLTTEVFAPELQNEQELRKNPRHSSFTEEMFQKILQSQDHFIRSVADHWKKTDFRLVERKNGRCSYISTASLTTPSTAIPTTSPTGDGSFESSILTLFTLKGVDYIKQEAALPLSIRKRSTERFSIQTEMDSYSPTEIVLSQKKALLYTTIEYGCYDRICVSDVVMGDGDMNAQVSLSF